MKRKTRIFIGIAIAILTTFSFSLSVMAEGDGYGANNGGNSGTSVTVTTASQLASYAGSSSAYNITVSGTIDLGTDGRVTVGSNTTIQGANTSATIVGTITINGVSNVIVKNLNITAPTGDPGDNDGLQVRGGSQGVLITNCTFYDCTDGCLDITHGGGTVTVSWCKFYYTRDNGHNFACLIGASDDDYGTYNTTWHHNWWAQGCIGRMTATRFGPCHFYNNYFSCSGNDYCTTSRNVCEMLSQNNYYDGVEDPLAKEQSGTLYTSGNIFNNCSGSQTTSYDDVFTPSYSYTLTSTSNVPSTVMAGAGNVGNTSSSGSGYYTITNRNSGKCVDVSSKSTSDNADIIQYTCNGGTNQQWSLQDAGSGYYRFVARHSGKCMRGLNGNVIQYTCNDGWWSEMFERIDAGSGYYILRNRSTETCLRVENSSGSDGASIILATCNTDYWSQQFSFSELKSADEVTETIETIEPISEITIYPNPANNYLNVALADRIQETISIRIVNSLGQIVIEKTNLSGELNTIDISSLGSGMYIVQVSKNKEVMNKIFIKN